MGKYRRLFLASIVGLTIHKLQAQKPFATIEKNYNVRAKDLFHELNSSKDTLLLQSTKPIDYVYAINSDYKREIDFYNNTNSLKIPLNQLSKGKHVFVVGHQKMQIIFVVRIQTETKKALAMVSKDQTTINGN
ncbi:hypothetical protein M0G43_05735 [Subsaxibacter sp. CAU 1640]|uniref:hypothetical protein n=1 Tax=Subsaxibacter sp. CAU 1640 TaxID=2933271 RepID=UPI0020030E0C|nr:hypothetical protein [Subsaxibacter sp. CAU 1640]MCK7590064.1 hypothetical protein [Subsaxibacter sp. CAU 1640]